MHQVRVFCYIAKLPAVEVKKRRLYQLHLLAWLLGILWICSLPAYAQQIVNSCNLQVILPELAQANVVYLGENHDNPEDHEIQLKIIQELHQRHRKTAIAMEMFQRPYQSILDRYLSGQLNEQELVEQTEYTQRWGFDWEYYAPLLRFAREKSLPVLALNTPTEVTRQVAREGLQSLTQQQQQFIPPLSEIRTDNLEYRQLMLATFKQHQQGGHGSSTDFERFFLAQVLWDETMAETIARFLQDNPDYQVVVLAGQGHIIYDYGIPSRVARRLKHKQLIARSLLLRPPEDASATGTQIADFVWQQQCKKLKTSQ